MALVQHPVVNANCKDGRSFTYNSNINVAVAVAINGGLITPVLQDADKVSAFMYLSLIIGIKYMNCLFLMIHCSYRWVFLSVSYSF